MKRRKFFKQVGIAACGYGLMSAQQSLFASTKEGKKPNIVFLFADQQRAQTWSGRDPQVKTPYLEQMAKEGVVFSNCISNYPLCSPYRASLISGQYARTNGVVDNVNKKDSALLSTDTKTIAHCLKEHGYATGYVGKWHLYAKDGNQGNNANPYLVPVGPYRYGFDYWRVCYNYTKRYDTRYLDEFGKVNILPKYAPASQMDLAFEFIEANKTKPFCVFVSWHPPHVPYSEAPDSYQKIYENMTIEYRPNVPEKERNKKLDVETKGYYSHVSALDNEVGRTIQKLKELRIDDNTIIVYTSDHGDMLGSRGLHGKNVPYEESILLPFFIRWPAGISGRRTLETLFSTVDIAPTLLGLSGIPVPETMEGVDMAGIITGAEKKEGPNSVFIMGEGWFGVRTKQYTYVIKDGKPDLLFDNKKDPYQMDNLLGKSDYKDIQDELQNKLDYYLKNKTRES
jgi:arylsulfatase A-like enzyme